MANLYVFSESAADLLRADLRTTVVDGQKWGNWQFELERLVLMYLRPGHYYEVDLEQCGSSAKVLDWLCQVHSKPWTSNEDVGDLLQAIDHLNDAALDSGGLQGSMCSWGKERMKGHNWALKLRKKALGAEGDQETAK